MDSVHGQYFRITDRSDCGWKNGIRGPLVYRYYRRCHTFRRVDHAVLFTGLLCGRHNSAFYCPVRRRLANARQSRGSRAPDCGFCSLCTCFCYYEAERLNSNDKGAFHSARQRGMLLCNCGVLHSYLLKYKPVMAAKHNFSLNLPRYPFF